ALATTAVAAYSRYQRSSSLDVLAQDFIKVARAKGLSDRLVYSRHLVRNASLPMITLIGLSLPLLIGGNVLIEYSFNVNGVGPLVYHTDQINTNLLNTDQPPGGGHPLGTDGNGFDVLGRIMRGGRTSLEIGFIAAVIAIVIGTLWGAVAGLIGGAADAVMMRI